MSGLGMVLILAGGFFLVVSAVGVLRLPDFYSRAHAAGKSETLGAILVLVGLAVHHGLSSTSVKLLLIPLILAATNPTGIHAMTRAALRSGTPFWTRRGPRTAGSASGAAGTEEQGSAP